jgi:hypothetical protein
MTPREQVLKALRGEAVDRVPFTVYECMLPQCRVERELRARGLCIVNRRTPVVHTRTPHCTTEEFTYEEAGRSRTRSVITTPVGELTSLREASELGFTSWTIERMFKSPTDYKALLCLIEDQEFSPNYDEFLKAERWMGDDVLMRGTIWKKAGLLNGLITAWMGVEAFAVEWNERRDEVLKLVDAAARKLREALPLVANSPCTHFNLGGNETPEVLGPPRFEQYHLPIYREWSQALHEHGILLGSHMDANNRAWKHLIPTSGLDYIEALTPAPDTDMTLGEARQAWPDQVLWLNFPSSVHLRPGAEVKQFTIDMLNGLSSVRGVIMGITEDVPAHRWQESFTAIMDGLDAHAREYPELYT